MSYVDAGKYRHIETCLTRQVESLATSGFERYELIGDLPDFSFAEIDLSTTLLGRRLDLPIMISSPTGGGGKSERINRNLAEAAQHLGLTMTVGSQRVMLEHPETRPSFEVRRFAKKAGIGQHSSFGLAILSGYKKEIKCQHPLLKQLRGIFPA